MLTREATTQQLFEALEEIGIVLPASTSRRTILDIAKDRGLIEAAGKAVLDEDATNEEIVEKLAEKGIVMPVDSDRKLLVRIARQNSLMGSGASKIPAQKRAEYGRDQNCGDELAEVLKEYCSGRVAEAIEEVAEANDIDIGKYEKLNPGMRRMTIGNILRSRIKNGKKVVIGNQVWNEDGEQAETA